MLDKHKIFHYKVTKSSKQVYISINRCREKGKRKHLVNWTTKPCTYSMCGKIQTAQLTEAVTALCSVVHVNKSFSSKCFENVIHRHAIPHKVSPHGHLATLCTSLRVTWHVNENFHNNLVTKQLCFSMTTVVFKNRLSSAVTWEQNAWCDRDRCVSRKRRYLCQGWRKYAGIPLRHDKNSNPVNKPWKQPKVSFFRHFLQINSLLGGSLVFEYTNWLPVTGSALRCSP